MRPHPIAFTVILAGLAACTASQKAVVPEPDALISSGGGVALVDRSGKGAVLCAWSMLAAAKQVGDRCYPGQDQALRKELNRSIERTQAFIVENSSAPVTRADLQSFKSARGPNDSMAPLGLCRSDWVELYVRFRDKGAEALTAYTDELLSLPREPVMNPCV